MILALIIILLAFAWLAKETDYFRVRLESTEYQRTQAEVKVNASTEPEKPSLYKPVEFTPLDMPEMTGTLNIICKRGIA